jgi:hypothetical protein
MPSAVVAPGTFVVIACAQVRPARGTSIPDLIAYLTNESQLDDRTIHLLFSTNCWEKRFALFTL